MLRPSDPAAFVTQRQSYCTPLLNKPHRARATMLPMVGLCTEPTRFPNDDLSAMRDIHVFDEQRLAQAIRSFLQPLRSNHLAHTRALTPQTAFTVPTFHSNNRGRRVEPRVILRDRAYRLHRTALITTSILHTTWVPKGDKLLEPLHGGPE